MEAVHALEPPILLLAVGILANIVMRSLRLSPIVGYLLAGILIGPYGMGVIEESPTTHLLAELGVVFLLFDIGLHFSLAQIWEARRDILGLGPLQVGLCTMAFAALLLVGAFELTLVVVIGATLALSSTAVVVQTLAEQGKQYCPVGVTATSVLIFQDICAIFLLILAASLGDPQTSLGLAAGAAAFKAAAAFLAAILIARYLVTPVLNLVAKARNEEVFTATALLIVLVTAAATGVLGLSLTLGAFLAGMIISETPYRYLIQTEVKPFRGLLMSFFFITVGMQISAEVLLRDWAWILIGTILLIIIKTLFIFLSALAVRVPLRTAIQIGFLLSQGSEFAFVIFGMPALRGALGPDLSALLITVVAASLALTPTLMSLGHRLAKHLADRYWQAQYTGEVSAPPPSAPIVIFGMGSVGRCVADALEAHGIPYTGIEMDHERFVAANANGYPVAFGDVGDLRLMEAIRMSERPSLVISIKRYEVSRDLTPILRERYPKLTRFIAVRNDEEKALFEVLGMRAVVLRSVPKGLDLAAVVLKAHGVSDEKVLAWMQEQQDQALAQASVEALAKAS